MERLTLAAQIGVLLPSLAAAAIIDWRTRRVPNTLVAPLAVAGIVIQTLEFGLRGLGLAATGALIGAACLLPFYLLRGMAAGDIKLMAAAGAWFEPALSAWAVIFTCLAGSVLGMALWFARRRRHGVPYAIAIATGTVAALWLAQSAAAAPLDMIPPIPHHGVSP
jgi:Flp pilus assembly protein protease CpaA